jgi:hypothetical protein
MSIARENINDGTIVDITVPGIHSASFAEMAANQSWDALLRGNLSANNVERNFPFMLKLITAVAAIGSLCAKVRRGKIYN